MRGRTLLIRLGALAVALPCIYIYEKYIEKPRILTTAPEPVLAAGWTQWKNPSGKDSLAVPPKFLICESTRKDFQDTLASLKKSNPVRAAEVEKLASSDPPPEGFVAVKLVDDKTDEITMSFCKFWIEHAPQIIGNGDGDLKDIGEAIAKEKPGFTFGPMQKIKTPATTAYVWTGTGTSSLGIAERITDILYLDKWDAFNVELVDMAPSMDAMGPNLAPQIAQTFREYRAHDAWKPGDQNN